MYVRAYNYQPERQRSAYRADGYGGQNYRLMGRPLPGSDYVESDYAIGTTAVNIERVGAPHTSGAVWPRSRDELGRSIPYQGVPMQRKRGTQGGGDEYDIVNTMPPSATLNKVPYSTFREQESVYDSTYNGVSSLNLLHGEQPMVDTLEPMRCNMPREGGMSHGTVVRPVESHDSSGALCSRTGCL